MILKYLRKSESLSRMKGKASAGARVAVWGNVGRVAWSPRDTASLTKIGFHGNPVGYRAVQDDRRGCRSASRHLPGRAPAL